MTDSVTDNLEVRDIHVAFAGLQALDGIDLQVSPGEIVGLIGPNGSGKTTLVNVITGYQSIDQGKVLLGGRDITGRPAHRLCRLGIARTFQAVRLFGRLTVAENIEIGALASRRSRRSCRVVVQRLLAEHGLEDLADVEARSLPYGSERTCDAGQGAGNGPQVLAVR